MPTRSAVVAAAASLLLAACSGGGNKCATVKCGAGMTCDPATGACVGGGTGGGSSTAGGSGTAGGTSTAGGSGTAGGMGMDGGMDAGRMLPAADGGVLAAGDTCNTPAVLPIGPTFRSTTGGLIDDYNFDTVGACTGSLENTADGVFRVSVPAGQRVTVNVQASFDAIVDLIRTPASNCGMNIAGMTEGITCVEGVDDVYAFGTERAQYYNGTATPQDVLVLVDGFAADEEGAFNISASLGAPPAGDVCASAPVLSATLSAETWPADFGNEYPIVPTGCAFGDGPDRLYKIDVPPLNRLTVVATPASEDIAISVIDGPEAHCAAPLACVGRADRFDVGQAETAIFNNSGSTVRSVYVHVSVFGQPVAGETFSLSATLSAIPAGPPGDVCSSATAIMPGTLTAQTTAGFYADYYLWAEAPGCRGYGVRGPDRVYAIDVNPGQTLTATVTPDARPDGGPGWDPAVYFVGGPAASCTTVIMQCLAAEDEAGRDMPDTARYTNDGGVAQSVFIVVDTFFDEEIPGYQLLTTLSP